MSTVPIISPSGDVGDIPFSQMKAAIAAGGKLGVNVTDPSGKPGIVPAERVQDAVKAGAKIVPYGEQDTQHPGFWAKAADLMGGLLHPSGFSPYPGMDQEAKSGAAGQSYDLNQSEKAAGYSPAYRALVPVARSAGTDVPGMEQSAKEGDVGGVAAAAAVPIATLVAGEALHQTGAVGKAVNALPDDPLSSIGRPVLRAAGSATDAVAGSLNPDLVGLASPRAAHALRLAQQAAKVMGTLGKEPEPATYPGAPLPENPGTFSGAPNPEAPAPELLQANALSKGGAAPPPEPASALSTVPVQPKIPLRPISELPPQAVHQALQEVGPQATIAAVTERANNIAKLGDLLNQGLGGKALEPNVPLKNQGGIITPTEPQTGIPEGHTPVESSALKSYKYDPETREFETMTQGGQGYVHAEISPEQAAAFKAADSKGKAWQAIRQNGTLVAKIVNGKRIPVKPVISEMDQIPEDEWNAGHELETTVEGSKR